MNWGCWSRADRVKRGVMNKHLPGKYSWHVVNSKPCIRNDLSMFVIDVHFNPAIFLSPHRLMTKVTLLCISFRLEGIFISSVDSSAGIPVTVATMGPHDFPPYCHLSLHFISTCLGLYPDNTGRF